MPEAGSRVAFSLRTETLRATDRSRTLGGLYERRRYPMIKVGLFVRLHAKAGKESEVEQLLKSGLAIVQEEPGTLLWFALRFDHSTFGIFDAFGDNGARQVHLAGRLAAALMAKAGDLLSEPPKIESVDVLASKI
jgi:quinol monooxygenase YgiN